MGVDLVADDENAQRPVGRKIRSADRDDGPEDQYGDSDEAIGAVRCRTGPFHAGYSTSWTALRPQAGASGNGQPSDEEDDRNRDGRPDLILHYQDGAVTEKTEDLDYDGLPDITSYYESGRLVRRTVSSEGALESWSDGTGS